MNAIKCPNCGTNDVESRGLGYFLYWGISLVICGIIFVLLFNSILPFIFVIMGIGSLIISPFAYFVGPDYKCENCGNTFEEEFEEEEVIQKEFNTPAVGNERSLNCPECGAKNKENASFCWDCGGEIDFEKELEFKYWT